ncbi:hypothetical protein EUX98_g8825 [Antrodiella citrinella]|uniref:Peptidase A2 domain-containing protein n=1 Tax=Antrodiella citrinella TaxID=2447956 RepID=A0A4S4M2B4_9APHY|nr:hypothetical protein EUX98_g8825 [Antrodiella citrinella]
MPTGAIDITQSPPRTDDAEAAEEAEVSNAMASSELQDAQRRESEESEDDDSPPGLSRSAIKEILETDDSEEATWYRDYIRRSRNKASTRDLILLNATHKLAASDIMDSGRQGGRTSDERFYVKPSVLSARESLMRILQTLLSKLSGCLPARVNKPERRYEINNHLDLLRMLKGCASVQRLQVTWGMLSERIEYGDRWVDKYYAELKDKTMLSPLTTPSVVAGQLGRLNSSIYDTGLRLQNNLAYVPSYRNLVAASNAEGRSPSTLARTDWSVLASAVIDEEVVDRYQLPDDGQDYGTYTFHAKTGERVEASAPPWKNDEKEGLPRTEQHNAEPGEWYSVRGRTGPNVTFAEQATEISPSYVPSSAGPSVHVADSISSVLWSQQKTAPSSSTPLPSVSLTPSQGNYALSGLANRSGSLRIPAVGSTASRLPNVPRFATASAVFRAPGESGATPIPPAPPPNLLSAPAPFSLNTASRSSRRGDGNDPTQSGGRDTFARSGNDPSWPGGSGGHFPSGGGGGPSGSGGGFNPPNGPPPPLPNTFPTSNSFPSGLFRGAPGGPPGGGNNGGYGSHWDPFFGRPSRMVPSIKYDFSYKDLPQWDGTRDVSAIKWFTAVQQLVAMDGYIPYQITQLLPFTFTPDSQVAHWYMWLGPDKKAVMSEHYTKFFEVLRALYLGRPWQQAQALVYERQKFRQKGYPTESPIEFLDRRILYSRILGSTAPDSYEEVEDILSAAPVAWANTLGLESLESVTHMLSRAYDRVSLLLEGTPTTVPVTQEDFPRLLARHLPQVQAGGHSSSYLRPFVRRANAAAASASPNDDDVEGADTALRSEDVPLGFAEEDATSYLLEGLSMSDPVVAEAYAIGKRQRPPPKDGYKYKKRDNVKSPVKPPPSPCKCCGSANHWDRECPSWNLWEAKYGKSANAVMRDNAYEDVYSQAFTNLNAQAATLSLYNDVLPRRSHYLNHSQLVARRLASCSLLETVQEELGEEYSPIDYATNQANQSYPRAFVEDVEDEDDLPHYPVAEVLLVEREGVPLDEKDLLDIPFSTRPRKAPVPSSESSSALPPQPPSLQLPPPLPPPPPSDQSDMLTWLRPKRHPRKGHSAMDVSVLAVKGRVGLGNTEIDLRLDSCADITLLSEEYYRTMINPPALQRGLRIELFQVTDNAAGLSGYVRVPILVDTTEGDTIAMEAEAYVLGRVQWIRLYFTV